MRANSIETLKFYFFQVPSLSLSLLLSFSPSISLPRILKVQSWGSISFALCHLTIINQHYKAQSFNVILKQNNQKSIERAMQNLYLILFFEKILSFIFYNRKDWRVGHIQNKINIHSNDRA